MDDFELELKVGFLDESAQGLTDVEQCFLSLEVASEDPTIIERIFRLVHNLKGSARAVGFADMGEFTHSLESLLLKVKNKELEIHKPMVDLLLKCNDFLKEWVEKLRADLAVKVDYAALLEEVKAHLAGTAPAAAAPEPTPETPVEPAPETPADPAVDAPIEAAVASETPSAEFAGEMPVENLTETSAETGVAAQATPHPTSAVELPTELSTNALPDPTAFEEPSPSAAVPTAEVASPATPSATVAEVAAPAMAAQENGATAPTSPAANPSGPASGASASAAPSVAGAAAAKAPASPPADENIRVSVKRLEKLVNNVGELVILQTVLNQQRHQIASPLLQKTVVQLAKITKDIQDISMSLRMVPLKSTFQKMTRIVRDTSKLLGKDVQLELVGEETELDKTMVEQLSDPLVHLIRNAVDHGLESPEDRVAAGKDRVGHVKLAAFHKGGQMVIEVKDDGKGLNAEKLVESAIKKGVLKPGATLSKEDAYRLIFAAGFSTKAEVSEISGRGVGMDVVRTNIEQQLHGEIDLETELGKGTTFRIRLPLTLAIIDGMVVTTGTDRFVVPLNHVFESLQPAQNDIHFVTGMGEMLVVRGEHMPLYRLSHALGIKTPLKPAWEGIAIVVRSGKVPFAIHVSDILGQQQVVIKSLGGELGNIRGIGGGAILGDGRAALILDLVELVHRNGIRLNAPVAGTRETTAAPKAPGPLQGVA